MKVLRILIALVMIINPVGLNFAVDRAHAQTALSEYPPQGLSSSNWTITDDSTNATLTNLNSNSITTQTTSNSSNSSINKYVTLTYNSSAGTTGFDINLGSSNVVDRVYLTGPTTGDGQSNVPASDGNPANWNNNVTSPPSGMIVVYTGTTNGSGSTTYTQAAQSILPPDAGNPVDTEADLRFQPVVADHIRVVIQTANIDWARYFYGATTNSTATPLTWNVAEVEVHGFAASSINATNYVVLPPSAAAAYAAGDTSITLNATPGNGSVTLGWYSTTGATNYTVERYNSTTGTYVPLPSTQSNPNPTTSAAYTDTTVTNGTTYYYAIQTNFPLSSFLSTDVAVTPNQYAPTAASTAQGLQNTAQTTAQTAYNNALAVYNSAHGTNYTTVNVSLPWVGVGANAGNNQVVLSWGGVSGATSYTIERSTGGQSYSVVATGLTTLKYTDSNLSNNTAYSYIIEAQGSTSITNSTNGNPSLSLTIPFTSYSQVETATPSSTTATTSPATNAINYGPLILAAQDLSYYLGKLTGNPVPITTASFMSSNPSYNYYVIEDLQPYAIDYKTMVANEQSVGNNPPVLPLDISVAQTGNQVIFSGWPYRNVLKSVWTFLADQGIHWVYPTPHGDYIPVTGSVDLNILPLSATSIGSTPKSIYANWNLLGFQAFAPWISQTMRQGFLNLLRNGWNTSENSGSLGLGGSEIPTPQPTTTSLDSNYSDPFTSFPHNFNGIIPTSILSANGWCGSPNADGSNQNCNTGAGGSTFNMTAPGLINWVAGEIDAVSAYAPEDASGTTIPTQNGWYGLLPIDATGWDETTASQQANSSSSTSIVPIPDPLPWVSDWGPSQSGAYYTFVNQVATDVAAYYSSNNLGTPPTIGALAYSDVFLPPPTWELSSSPTTSGNGPLMASNILIEICQYGSPNLPMTSAPNAAFKAAMDSWHNLAQASGFKLGNYDYSLLHTDLWQQNPEFPVPLVYGTVDHANYLSSIGALEGGVQANVSSLPYNPWNFYAYPRIRQNMTLTAAQIENEFFTSYFKEASAHMLAYYQTMENWQVQNSVNMWDKGYNYSIMQGSFPNQILNTMYLDLQKAQSDAQSAPWFIKQRVANIAAGFQWILNQLNLQNSDLTNTTEYQTALNPNNAAKTLNLLYGVIPQYLAPGDNSAYINDGGGGACTSSTTGYTLSSHCTNTPPPSPSWGILGGDIYEPLYFSQAGTYHIAMQVKGNANSQFTVYLGPQNLGTITLPATPTLSTYTINASVPDGFGVQDLWMHNSGGSVTIYNITVSLATSGPSNLGDVNGAVDGNGNPVVSIVDAEETAQEAIGVDVPGFITANALVDNGTSVDINDAYLIAEYAVKKITTFPASSA